MVFQFFINLKDELIYRKKIQEFLLSFSKDQVNEILNIDKDFGEIRFTTYDFESDTIVEASYSFENYIKNECKRGIQDFDLSISEIHKKGSSLKVFVKEEYEILKNLVNLSNNHPSKAYIDSLSKIVNYIESNFNYFLNDSVEVDSEIIFSSFNWIGEKDELLELHDNLQNKGFIAANKIDFVNAFTNKPFDQKIKWNINYLGLLLMFIHYLSYNRLISDHFTDEANDTINKKINSVFCKADGSRLDIKGAKSDYKEIVDLDIPDFEDYVEKRIRGKAYFKILLDFLR